MKNKPALDAMINVHVTELKDIRFEIKKIKFQLANLDTIFPMNQKELQKHSVFLYKTKRMLREKRDKLVKEGEDNGKY